MNIDQIKSAYQGAPVTELLASLAGIKQGGMFGPYKFPEWMRKALGHKFGIVPQGIRHGLTVRHKVSGSLYVLAARNENAAIFTDGEAVITLDVSNTLYVRDFPLELTEENFLNKADEKVKQHLQESLHSVPVAKLFELMSPSPSLARIEALLNMPRRSLAQHLGLGPDTKVDTRTMRLMAITRIVKELRAPL